MDADLSRQKGLRDDLGGLAATQDAELYAIKTELRKLAGMLEEIEFRLNTDTADQAARLAEMNTRLLENTDRLSRMETFLGMDFSERTEPGSREDDPPEANLEDMGEQELYRVGKQMFDNQEFDDALDAFALFIEKFPKSNLADNARFWTGEVYFAEQWYEKAIVEYQRVIDDYPRGNKVPAAYLKQGISFSLLGEKENALFRLRELVRLFPDHDKARIAERRITELNQ